MKLWRFVRKNVFRNKRRTILTVVSLAVSIFIVNTLASVLRGFENTDPGTAGHLRLLTRHKVSLTNPLPESYWEKLKQVPHVEALTPWSWFGGVYKDETQQNWFARFSADPDGYLAVVGAERPLPADQARAWKEDRRGAIAGASLVQKHGWKIGDLITIKGDIYPVDLEVTLRGVYTAKNTEDESVLVFHHQYLEELTGRRGTVGTYWIRVDKAENMVPLAKTIDAKFENSDAETLTETEQQFNADFVSMMGNVTGLIRMLSLVVAGAILMVSANTMAMAVRERTTEVAVMKAIGFSPGSILGAIVGESVLIALTAWAFACLGSLLLFNLTGFRLPFLWTPMALTPWAALAAAVVALTIGLVSGIIPGFFASRLSVVDGLRKVA